MKGENNDRTHSGHRTFHLVSAAQVRARAGRLHSTRENGRPYIEKSGDLAGLIIEAPKFPGWESLGAMAAHIRFVRDHHKRIRKIGLVTDSALGTVAERLASHFVSAEIRHFSAAKLEAAKQWVMKRP